MKKKCLFSGLLLCLALMLPGLLSAEVHNCSGGCIIITCDGSMCSVWQCDDSGCVKVTEYPQNHVQGMDGDGSRAGTAGTFCGEQPCAIKSCDPQYCSVYGFDQGEMSLLGRLDNIDSVLEEVARDFIEDLDR